MKFSEVLRCIACNHHQIYMHIVATLLKKSIFVCSMRDPTEQKDDFLQREGLELLTVYICHAQASLVRKNHEY
jgi:hypothetical protein